MGAFLGVLATHVQGALDKNGRRRAFHILKAAARKGRGARAVALTVLTNADNRALRALGKWRLRTTHPASRRRRINQALQRRVLLKAWLHWWSMVEVVRELEVLQRGVRALVRVRPARASV